VAFNAGCTDAVGCAGFYRAFAVATSPAGSSFYPTSTVTGVSAAAVGVQAASNGGITAANFDLAGVRIKNPADTTDSNKGLSFYYAYLGASGVWNNSTSTGSISGSLLEISSTVSYIQVYYDRDGTPGFYWDLTQPQNDVYTCTAGGTYDCFDTNGNIDVTKLLWSDISLNITNCSLAVPGAGYAADCTIQTFTSSGALTVGGAAVLTVTARTASQPITVNGVLISPMKVKWDVDITVPWSYFTGTTALSSPTTAKIALIFFHAGKAASGSAVATVTGAGASVVSNLVFNGAGGLASYFGYTGTATVDSNTATVHTEVVTGAQVLAFNPTGATSIIVVTLLKAYIGVLQGFGWTVQLSFHSFDIAHPTVISWDPEVGMTNATASSPAALLVPGVGVLALLTLFN